ncbi:UDP-N-acetylmuramate dehydrogenase [bacterium]|nr:UDP-N-acetylmuramate dehydrogenase [bacterium]
MINVQKNVPLAPYATFKIGGPAKFFTEVKNEKELIKALAYAEKNGLECFVLAGGSNVLISDNGFNGLVIKIRDTRYAIRDTRVECGAGILLSEIVSKTAKAGLSGLEWAAGIPGTIGGAVRGNAGAFGGCMADAVEKVRVVVQGKPQAVNYKLQECKFGYRSSIFKEKQNIIILSVILKLKKGNAEKIQQRVESIIIKRKEKQPRFPSAGSFFKNPIVNDEKIIKKFESDTGLKMKDNKIPAGWLIEEAGLKGKKIGGAQVSKKHSNFIINTGGATAEDVIMLASIIKQRIRSVFNIQLMEEAQLVGF